MGGRTRRERRIPLTRDRVLRTALAIADAEGIEALTMRRVGDAVGVEAMTLYRHVENKHDLVDGIVDLVYAEMYLPIGTDWRLAMRQRAISVRAVLLRHPWAITLLESSMTPGPANMRHHDAVIGCLIASGFDMAMAAHAYSVLDSYIFGFAMTQTNIPIDTTNVAEVGNAILAQFPVDAYPNLGAFITQHAMQPGYDYAKEFEWGLDLILDGLERAAAAIRG